MAIKVGDREFTLREWEAIQRAEAAGCDHEGFVRQGTGGTVFHWHDVCHVCGSFRWASESESTPWTLYPERMRSVANSSKTRGDLVREALEKADQLANAVYMRETPEFIKERCREYNIARWAVMEIDRAATLGVGHRG